MNKLSKTIRVEVTNLNVGIEYYSFDWKIFENNELVADGTYDNDHVWGTSKRDMEVFKKDLEEGRAISLALGEYYD